VRRREGEEHHAQRQVSEKSAPYYIDSVKALCADFSEFLPGLGGVCAATRLTATTTKKSECSRTCTI
jgi:hypothetical protein